MRYVSPLRTQQAATWGVAKLFHHRHKALHIHIVFPTPPLSKQPACLVQLSTRQTCLVVPSFIDSTVAARVLWPGSNSQFGVPPAEDTISTQPSEGTSCKHTLSAQGRPAHPVGPTMEYEPAEYQKLQIRQYAPRSIRETAEGKFWRRFEAPIVAKQV